MLSHIRKRILLEWSILTMAALAVCAWLTIYNPLSRADNFLFDVFASLVTRPAPDDILIIAIDDKSIEELGPWPWDRRLHAKLLYQLTPSSPSAIVFDVLFKDAIDFQDVELRSAILQAPPVFLPLAFESGSQQPPKVAYPIETLRTATTGLGHIYIEVAADSSARDVYLWQKGQQAAIPHLSLAVCRHLSEECGLRYSVPDVENSTLTSGIAGSFIMDSYRMIPFAGAPGHFLRISYVDVLTGKIPTELLKNKIVFIGTTSPALGDYFATPTSWNFTPMAGVEILTNVFDMLRQPKTLHPLNTSYTLIVSILLVLCSMGVFLFIGPKSNGLALLVFVGSIFLLSMVLLKFYWIWFSPITLMVTMLLTFPFWSWRRLEALQKDLDDRVQQLLDIPLLLDNQPMPIHVPLIESTNPIQDRIERLRLIADRLRSTQALVLHALEAFPGSVLITDNQLRIVLINQQALTLAPHQGALYDKPLVEFLRSIGLPDAMDLEAVIEQVTTLNQTSAFQLKSDKNFYLVSIAPCHQPDMPGNTLVVCILDITFWQRAKENREDFMRFLSHDIRSPLSSIVMALDESMIPENLEQAHHDLLEKVRNYANRSLKLADSFLHLAKAESVDPEKFVEVELFDIIEIAVDDLWPQATANQIAILIEDNTGLRRKQGAWLFGERDLLIRMFINLLVNALKYSPSNRKIIIRVEKTSVDWIIHIIDEGDGIPPDRLEHIFGKFERARQNQQYYQEGIGLGLVIVKTIVDRHHGQIKVSSTLGVGTCFSVHFPIVSTPEFSDPDEEKMEFSPDDEGK